MNEIVSKLLVAGDKVITEIHLGWIYTINIYIYIYIYILCNAKIKILSMRDLILLT